VSSITFEVCGLKESSSREIAINRLVIAGWTGRDSVAMEAHIRELEVLGVKRPPYMPVFYQIAASRLTIDASMEVCGEASSGEVEFLLIRSGGEYLVGVASDHTDREVEKFDITASKQMCEKPCAPTLWRLSDIEAHWDQLILRSYATINGKRELYQQSHVTTMHAPRDLIGKFESHGEAPANGTAILGGTLAAIGGIRPSSRFEIELEDPVLKRKLSHSYEIKDLPVPG
jgi:hypothetical protein